MSTSPDLQSSLSPTNSSSRWTARLFSPRNIAVFVILIALLVCGPIVLGTYWTRIFTVSAIFAIAAAGIALLYGRLGLVSLFQVALIGVGGWITLRVGHATSLPFEVLLVIAAIGTGLIGVLVGLPALRLSGINLAIVTLMVAGAFEVLFNLTGFPNGGADFLGRAQGGVLQSPLARPAIAQTDDGYFRYVLVVAIIMFVIIGVHLSSRPGRAWAAIRQSEAGAIAAGIGTVQYRLWALAVVSATTGVAGGLLAGNAGLLDPISFKASQSILLFATVLIGGPFSLLGAVIAGFFSRASRHC